MLFHRPVEKTVSIFLRFFEDRTPGVQEGSQGRDEGDQLVVGSESFQEEAAVVDRLHDGCVGLLRKTGHEEEVDPFAAEVDGIGDHLLQGLIIVGSAKGPPDLFVMGFGRDLDVEVEDRFGNLFKKGLEGGTKNSKAI